MPTTALTLAMALAAEQVVYQPPQTATEIRACWRKLVPEQRRHFRRKAERLLALLQVLGPEGENGAE